MSRATNSSPELSYLSGKIDELPLLPHVLTRILQIDTDADDYFEQFELLSKEDPALAVKLLSMANSAASSPQNTIVTIRGALSRIGVATVGELVASLAVQRVFVPTKPSQVKLWCHSIIVAVVSEQIAKLTPDLKIDPSQAYLCGLLHDIGRFVMLEHASSELLQVEEHEWDSPEKLIEADIEVFRFTHCELGYLACGHWGLPQTIADVVRDHHREISSKVEVGSFTALLFCVQLADRLSIELIENKEKDDVDLACLKAVVDRDFSPALVSSLLPLGSLLGSFDDIRNSCDFLLSGLGFSRQV